MLHFEKESGRERSKCSAGGRTSPSPLNGHVSAPCCQCAGCVVHGPVSSLHSTTPNLPLRPDGVCMLEHDKSEVDGSVKAGDDHSTPADSSYVQFARSEADLATVAAGHEYCYPTTELVEPTSAGQAFGQLDTAPRVSRSPMDAKKISTAAAVRSPRRPQAQCMYCLKLFDPGLGKDRCKCRDAPDRVMEWIQFASCACVPDAVAYLCFADSEGDYEPACACTGGLSRRSVLKWTVLVVTSVFLPCLCCFWPLIGCRRCAMRHGFCVPQHQAA